MSFKAAAVQMCSGVDPVRNAAAMARLVREAAARGATYVQTPEMTGMLQRDRAAARAVLADETRDIIVKTGSELASELGIYMHVGSTAIALTDGKIANRGFLFGPDGRILNRYDKIHMFDVDLDNGESWRESAFYTAGSEARVLSLPFAEMGFAICYDVRFPALFRAQAVAGAEVMTVPAVFTKQTGEAHWEILLRARAIENGVFVVAAAQAGRHEDGRHEDGRETFGHSMIIDPWGTVLASGGATGEAVIVAEIDPGAVKAAHDKIPNLRNGREFSVEKIAGAVAGGVAA
ncbi:MULTISPECIES: carbon-nitrogen hydrolase family protein [Rhizobium]|uniref:carbon-nitrogen hydrolase family protein n=1 Tax=Rhizobium TaxID=379 RepID=UPI001B32EDF5|nr:MULTISPECIES: carbon-nitrogen hydrolase family protein [Rhizobium]MBX4911843.1 carbon-nitrogen hydrolase family protein [Rhizobium bangladeshense]MBX5218605.1 carbon-nitrogen hydrolase family protein [Rhizobium sp. NLR9a]MBX5224705.1 carbon-nitrogen hydrolase family protein [Rhizobium sp. NLR8a]MBX5230328.1 carbon-nitrogen hydrolase family protein [Rhizobium sp. NLR9b]MBX5236523.1 carbon-nitrogen hydrolase family protein [Rhizobium sp. NLR4a]